MRRLWDLDLGARGVEEGEDRVGLPEASAQGNKGRADDGGGFSDPGAVGRARECWQGGVFAGFELMAHAPK